MRSGFDFENELIFMLAAMVFEFNAMKLDVLCSWWYVEWEISVIWIFEHQYQLLSNIILYL